MENLVLYRKYRPQKFADVAGQDHVTVTIANEIKTGHTAHAYLFSGPRGCGKTTTARIIARALNCVGPDGKGGPTADPCGACPECRAISSMGITWTRLGLVSITGLLISFIFQGLADFSITAAWMDC
jgi:DNA polymerase III gamma/tau subunit